MSFWYMVKNIQTADKNAAENPDVYSFIQPVSPNDSWDMVEYLSEKSSWAAGTHYVVRLAMSEVQQNILNPLWKSYVNESNKSASLLVFPYLMNNREDSLATLDEVLPGLLMKNAVNWTPADKTSIRNQLKPVYTSTIIGDIGGVIEEIQAITPVAPLTDQILNDLLAEFYVYKRKFPDGSTVTGGLDAIGFCNPGEFNTADGDYLIITTRS